MDGESSDGCSPETTQPKGRFGESKTSPSRQEARGRSKITARFQKVWQDEVLKLHLLQQHQDPHEHLDRPDLADQAEHHV